MLESLSVPDPNSGPLTPLAVPTKALVCTNLVIAAFVIDLLDCSHVIALSQTGSMFIEVGRMSCPSPSDHMHLKGASVVRCWICYKL